jgi:uncharacterized membrane protein
MLTIMNVLALAGSALMAGTFFAFSGFVMAALARLPPAEGIAAMQAINRAAVNPWFLAVFLGTPAVCVLLVVLVVFGWTGPGSVLLILGCILHVVGSFGVTALCNVPLNDALAAAEPHAESGAELWRSYLGRWTAWNHVRAVASLAAVVLLALALRLAPLAPAA